MAPKGSERVVKKVVAENRKARFNYEFSIPMKPASC